MTSQLKLFGDFMYIPNTNSFTGSKTTATVLHADNQGCIALAWNQVTHTCTKHIDIHHHFIWERVDHGEIDLQYCSSKDMLADILTKQLPREAFERFRGELGVGGN